MQSLDEGDAAKLARAWVFGYSVLILFTLFVAVLVRSPAPLAFLAGILLLAERLRRAAPWDRHRREGTTMRTMGYKVRVPLRTARSR